MFTQNYGINTLTPPLTSTINPDMITVIVKSFNKNEGVLFLTGNSPECSESVQFRILLEWYLFINIHKNPRYY